MPGAYTTEMRFSPFWRQRNPRSRCRLIWFLARAHFLACPWMPFGRDHPVSLLPGSLTPLPEGPALAASLTPKGPTSKPSPWKSRALTCEFWGDTDIRFTAARCVRKECRNIGDQASTGEFQASPGTSRPGDAPYYGGEIGGHSFPVLRLPSLLPSPISEGDSPFLGCRISKVAEDRGCIFCR